MGAAPLERTAISFDQGLQILIWSGFIYKYLHHTAFLVDYVDQ